MRVWFNSALGHRIFTNEVLVGSDPDQHFALSGLVGHMEPERPVETDLLPSLDATQRVQGISGRVDQLGDSLAGEDTALGRAQLGRGGGATGFGFADPLGDGLGGSGSGIDEVPVAGELLVAVPDDGSSLGGCVGRGCCGDG
ncbi:hypothetical protein [Streptomyces chattanoogensis]|uniref:hypothetical protein n=1 Tax=Streptomyces chattanoogensis TaxID=66876 RepID=UPI0012FEF07A|nr:hypothetical protein [Streptomyces chattanoogensis]